MTLTQRERKSEVVDNSLDYSLDGMTIDEAIAYLKKEQDRLIQKYPSSTPFIRISYGYDDHDELHLVMEREETDEEFAARVKKVKESDEILLKQRQEQVQALAASLGMKLVPMEDGSK